jgi:hypothetical protein
LRTSKLWAIFAPAVLLLSLQLTSPTPAHADTYQLFDLGADSHFSFDGLSSSGLAVFDNTGDPACGTSTCFYSFLNGVSQGTTGTSPIFTPDDGSHCTPSLPSGWFVQNAVCNNGHVAWTGSGVNPPEDVYFNLNPTQPSSGPQFGGSALYIDSIGDTVIDDAFSDDWYFALDQTTLTALTAVPPPPTTAPEPSTFLLLATGILAPIFFLRRRRTAAIRI